jgi:hypothetical protein
MFLRISVSHYFAEEQQRFERQSKQTNFSTLSFPPINTTNVLPPSSHQSPTASSADPVPAPIAYSLDIASLDIPGPRDVAVRMYA